MVLFAHLHSSPLVVRHGNSESELKPVEIIDVKQERKLLLQCLRECGRILQWRSEVADPHTFRKVVSYGCRALHFSGHGVNGKVIFENGKCEAHFLSQSELKNLLMAGGSVQLPMKLVFVSACHSESVSEAFVGAGVPHVVVVPNDDKVLDRNALEFSKAFYTALFIGHSVQESFEIGQAQADVCLSEGGSKFKLLGQGDHSESIFSDLEPGPYIDQTPPLPINESDSVAEFFVGRSIEVHRVYTALVEGARLISLVGVNGIGKSEVALQCSQYAMDRYLFQHIYFLRFPQEYKHAIGSYSSNTTQNFPTLLQQVGTCFGVEATNISDLTESIRRKCAEGNFLAIFDGCEDEIVLSKKKIDVSKENGEEATFRQVIAQLLRRVPTLSLLLTTLVPLGSMDSAGERVIPISRLSPMDAALLFSVRAPRKLRQAEIGGDMDLPSLSKHPVLSALGGHPSVICTVAQELTDHELDVHQEKFLGTLIPSTLQLLSLTPVLETQNVVEQASDDHSMSQLLVMKSIRSLYLDKGSVSYSKSYEDTMIPPPPLQPMLRGSISDTILDRESLGGYSKANSGNRGDDRSRLIFLDAVNRVLPVIQDRDGCMVWVQAVQMRLIMSNFSSNSDSALSLSTNMDRIEYDYLGQQLCRHFATVMQSEAGQRPLSLRSLEFLKSSNSVWGRGNSPANMQGIVSLNMFAVFWKWFQQLLVCIRATGIWGQTSPRLLHGFLSKDYAVSILNGMPAGTFLVRFSESKLSCLAIAYTREDDGGIQFVLVDYRNPGFQLMIDGHPMVFPTLHQLLNSVNVLKTLYPNTPKEIAFRL